MDYSLYRATQATQKQKEERKVFLLKNKLEFAKQIVLEAGDYLSSSHVTLISKKTGLLSYSNLDGPAGSKDLVEKIILPRRSDFGGKMALLHDFSERIVWVIDLLIGPINFVTKRKIFSDGPKTGWSDLAWSDSDARSCFYRVKVQWHL